MVTSSSKADFLFEVTVGKNGPGCCAIFPPRSVKIHIRGSNRKNIYADGGNYPESSVPPGLKSNLAGLYLNIELILQEKFDFLRKELQAKSKGLVLVRTIPGQAAEHFLNGDC